MTRRFDRLRYHVADDPDAEGWPRPADTFRGIAPGESGVEARRFTSAEAAARFYLAEKLAEEDRPAFRSAAPPDRPERVPDLAVQTAREMPATGTTLVRFQQTHEQIPVFGGQAVVELDDSKGLVAMDVRLGEVIDVPSRPTLTAEDAVARVAEAAGTELDATALPIAELAFFQDDQTGTWHLAWHLHDVPAELPEARRGDATTGHRLDPSPRDAQPLVDYLVDAHDGTILYYYGATPTAAIPVKLRGTDENGKLQDRIWGDKLSNAYAMQDPVRNIRTFDLGLGDIQGAVLPPNTISTSAPDLGSQFKAAVSAHANATRVHDFYNSVLHRDGIDDQDMDLVSVINCFYSMHGPGPVWRNAVWWRKRMWYGQIREPDGSLVSMARFLDIIAHELTHGVIDWSCKLVYRDQSGALNESFADIFGGIIKNWYEAPSPLDVSTWNWEMGPGLGDGGLPLRDLSDPARTGDPAHMDDFLHTSADFGGVHTNSNIHNKAVHLLLTATTATGEPVLGPEDWAVLLYHTLVRLPALAAFIDVPPALRDVTKTYLSGSTQQQQAVFTAIDDAYQKVGIA
jgi:Zn-dependent metalloprotease